MTAAKFAEIATKNEVKIMYATITDKNGDKIMFRCFGQFSIEYQGVYLNLRIKKSREILAFLLMERGRPIVKKRVAETLWADKEPAKAAGCFYKSLCRLSEEIKSYGAAFPLRSSGNLIWLDMRFIESDVTQFEELCKKNDPAAFRAAAALYTSPFLSKEDYEWTEQWQAYYDFKYVNVIQKLIGYYETENPRLANYYKKVQYRI